MTNLNVFKANLSDKYAIEKLNEQVEEFILDKEVVSTNILNAGIEMYIYVFYKGR